MLNNALIRISSLSFSLHHPHVHYFLPHNFTSHSIFPTLFFDDRFVGNTQCFPHSVVPQCCPTRCCPHRVASTVFSSLRCPHSVVPQCCSNIVFPTVHVLLPHRSPPVLPQQFHPHIVARSVVPTVLPPQCCPDCDATTVLPPQCFPNSDTVALWPTVLPPLRSPTVLPQQCCPTVLPHRVSSTVLPNIVPHPQYCLRCNAPQFCPTVCDLL